MSQARTLPAHTKPSSGWANVREMLRGPKVHQTHAALKSAGRMTLLLPVVQVILVVGLLNSEWWLGLLGLEGLLIGALATSQLGQRDSQYRLLGLGMAFVNFLALSIIGLFAGSHLFWISGLLGFFPICTLVLLPTGRRSLVLTWGFYGLIIAVMFAAAGVARFCVETAGTDENQVTRRHKLTIAWVAFTLRGGNGTERALLRLRMAQSAFASDDFEAAFYLANDGVIHPDQRAREIPASPLAQYLLQSLMQVKSQAFYNMAWGKHEPMQSRIGPEPLDDETLDHPEVRVKWGY